MNIDYRAFIRDNIAFARTIVIKNEDIAIADNQLMLRYYGIPIPQDKSQWRYYLNLAGEYHQTDDMMTVKSLDNEELIPFTRASLDDHPATRKAYRLGSYYFSRLAAKYPHQIELIQGIINPISYEEAVAAKNYQILRYTKSYVEWNESQLIPLLQEHINGMTYQSFSTEYKFTDNLMLPFLVVHLRETVLRFLITCRFEHRFSRHAHSFFVWSHLQSKGISKIYKPFLNEHQTMWLFRNIDYLLRHLGKAANFELLIAHILSERDIALTKYDLIQSTETLTETLSPTPLFHSERINLIARKGKGEDTRSLPVVMTKEIPESLDNNDFYEPFLETTTYESTYGEINSYPTKILESEMIDATNSKTETFFMLLNNELIYLASKNLYTINLDIEDPLTGIHHTIPVKDAIVLWHDLLNLYHGIDNDKIGYFYYQGVMKITPPSLSAMMKLGTLPFLNEGWCRDALKLHIPQIRIVSPTVFYENALSIFHTKWKHKKMASFWASWGYVSQRQNAVDSMYEMGFAKLTTFTSFKALREKYQFDFSKYEKSNILTLMWVLWRKMTGWDNFSHQTLAQLQEALINLMRHLSSYSLQYIYQTNVESGWYEAGVDLMTENPSLANRGEDPGNELENDSVDASTIIDENKVLTIEESLSIAEYKLAELAFETEYEDTATDALWDNMQLTLVEFDEDAGTEGDIHTFPLYIDMVPTLAYAMVEDNLDKIIPTVGTVPEYRALSSVFTPFDGLLAATPYTTVTMQVVKNGFDNENVLYDYHGLDASPQVLTTTSGDKRHYDMSFVPAEPGDYILRLDIVTKDSQHDKTVNARFDYPYTVKEADWTITYTIPDSAEVGTPFEITPVITGLTLSGASVTKQTWKVDENISDYLKVEEKDGKIMGTFLKDDEPDKLPLHLCLTTGDGASARRYYMTGYVPHPQPYDPLKDDDFIPVFKYNEADTLACVKENVSIVSGKSGWSVTALTLKRTQGDNLSDDYLGLKGWLGPTLTRVADSTSQDKTLMNWQLLYGAKTTQVKLTLVVTLTHTSGEIVTRTSTHTPTVVNHGATRTFWLQPHDLKNETVDSYLYGVGYTTNVDLGMEGLSGAENASKTNIAVTGLLALTELNGTHILTLPSPGDSSIKVSNNQVNQMPLTPSQETTQSTIQIAAQFDATAPMSSGTGKLPLVIYGVASLKGENIVDYDVVDFDLDSFESWGTGNEIYQDVAWPVRKAAKKSRRGWTFEYGSVSNTWPDYIPNKLNFGITSSDILTVSRTVLSGKEKDGNEVLPSQYEFWVTFRVLYQPTDNMPEKAVIPFTATLKNRYSGKTTSVELSVPFTFSEKRLLTTTDPDKIYAGDTLLLKPDWSAVPFETHFPMQRTRYSFYSFGTYYFVKQDGSNLRASCKMDTDYNITMMVPPPYISSGRGIYMVLATVWEPTDTTNSTSSLGYITYYQIIDFKLNQNIFTTERAPYNPAEDDDFIPVLKYNEADRYACVKEQVSILASKSNWSVTNLEVQRTQDDNLADDYLGMKNWLGPTLTKLNDTSAGQSNARKNWQLLYGVKGDEVTLNLVVTWAHTDGKTVSRTFTFNPTVVDHGTTNSFWIAPHTLSNGETAEDYLYGVSYSTQVDIGMTGLSGKENASKTNVVATSVVAMKEVGDDPVLTLPGAPQNLQVQYNQITQMTFVAKKEPSVDVVNIAIQFNATAPTSTGTKLPLVLYGAAPIKGENIVDYDIVDFYPEDFETWGTDELIYQDVTIPVRKAAKKSRRGWNYVSGGQASTWPDYIPSELDYSVINYEKISVNRTVAVGKDKDGAEVLPDKYEFWVTFCVLYEPTDDLPERPLLSFIATFKNRYTGKTVTSEIKVPYVFSQKRLFSTCVPDKIYAGETLTLVPDWSGAPYPMHLPMKKTYTGFYTFGTMFFKDSSGNRVSAKLDKETANITLSVPAPPISKGRGIYMVYVTTYEPSEEEDARSSLAYTTYHQTIDFVYNVNLFTTERPSS